MKNQKEPIHIIGIQVRTSNNNNRAAQDIGAMWNKIYQENIGGQVPQKVSSDLYAVYSHYESNFKEEYTYTLGYRVSNLDEIPEGLHGNSIEPGNYKTFLAKGTMPMPIITAWEEIWELENKLNRSYQTDYEVYSEKANQGDQSEVPIFIGINN